MFPVKVLCFFSGFLAISANPLNLDSTILNLFKTKPLMATKKLTMYGQAHDIKPWELQNLEVGKQMISRPFVAGTDLTAQNRFPAQSFDPLQMNKINQLSQSYAPFSDQKDSPQFPTINFQGQIPNCNPSSIQKQQDAPNFPDPESIAMQSFPGDINVAALHAMNYRNPNMPNLDTKGFLRDQVQESQLKLQQQRELLQNFANENPELSQLKMLKKPMGLFDGINLSPDFFKKSFNRNNPRENNVFGDEMSLTGFPPRG